MIITEISKINFLFVMLTVIFLISCQQTTDIPKDFVEEGITLAVSIPMGEYKNNEESYPAIGNLAYLVENNNDSTEVIILSQRIEKKQKVTVDIFAAMVYEVDNQQYRIFVAIPVTELLHYPKIDDFLAFSVQYGAIKRMIEQWYLSNHPLGDFKLLKWENKNQVNQFIEEHWNVE